MIEIKLIIVDDQRLIREGLDSLFEKERDKEIILSTGDPRKALKECKKTPPDVVITELYLKGKNAVDLTRELRQDNPGIKVIGLSGICKKHRILRFLHAGAKGFLWKGTSFSHLLEAINNVKKDMFYLGPNVSNMFVEDLLKYGSIENISEIFSFTERELAVLEKLGMGMTTREIAAELEISIKTVQAYVKKLMKKTNLDSLPALVRYAIVEDITQ